MAGYKLPVRWHKEGLKNSRLLIADLRKQRGLLDERMARLERECDYLQAQIEQAEAENITEFDAERFKPKTKRKAK